MSIFSFIRNVYHTRNNHSFANYLRSCGVEVGSHCVFRYPRTIRIDTSRPSLVSIGNYVDMNMNFQILVHDWGCFVFRNKYHDFINSTGKVTIGNNIYFGTNVTVLKGVTIGDNCIIGAGSIVTHDIPENSVAVGVPCKVVCTLDDYYLKRKKVAIKEAFEHVLAIEERYHRRPYPKEMIEEFIYFVDKFNWEEYENEGVPIIKQLDVAFDDFMKNHKPMFENFYSFINAAERSKENDK